MSGIRKSQIRKLQKLYDPQIANRKLPHLQKACKSKQKFKLATLRICALRNLFVDRPSLMYGKKERKNYNNKHFLMNV